MSITWPFERSSQAEVNVSTEVTVHQKTRRSFLVVRRGLTSQWSTDGQSQTEIKYVRRTRRLDRGRDTVITTVTIVSSHRLRNHQPMLSSSTPACILSYIFSLCKQSLYVVELFNYFKLFCNRPKYSYNCIFILHCLPHSNSTTILIAQLLSFNISSKATDLPR